VALRGKKVSVVSWDDNAKMEHWIAKLVEAYGFPKTDDKKSTASPKKSRAFSLSEMANTTRKTN